MEDWKPEYLSLGPGGSKGFYILGALYHLKNKGYFRNLKGYIGCSVGAMISLLLNVGYEPIEILTISADTHIFSDFFSVALSDRMTEIKDNLGLTSNNHIARRLEDAIKAKICILPTLKTLYHMTGLELYTVTYDIENRKPVYISHLTHPDMPAVTAVMLSINIPILFYRLYYQGVPYMDGAFGDPLPIAPLDDGSNRIFSISILTKPNVAENSSKLYQLTNYIQSIIMASINQLASMTIAIASKECRFLRIIDTTGTSLSAVDKAKMFRDGLEAGKNYLLEGNNLDELEVDGVATMLELLESAQSRVYIYEATDV